MKQDSAEWESRIENRQTGVVTWHNVVTNEKKRFKPSVLVSTTDKIWRYTIGNVTEVLRLRTEQGYKRKIWDHGQERSPWGKNGPPKKTVGTKLGEEELDVNDPNYVGPWLCEEVVDGSTGGMKTIYVRRRGKPGENGEIVEQQDEKPDALMSKDEKKDKDEVEAAIKEKEKNAKDSKMKMEVAKAARERAKKRKKKRK